MKSAISIFILSTIILSGCIEPAYDQYCGCPEFKPIGIVKDFNINKQTGIFYESTYCTVMLDNTKIFIENDICKDLKTGMILYKSLNRNGFYAICDPNINYITKDECEFDINDINNATANAFKI